MADVIEIPRPLAARSPSARVALRAGDANAQPLHAQPLHAQVALRLRQMLVEGQIAPGAKLNERELSTVLQVSRTPLREAIRMLAAEGLVELHANRGAVALALDRDAIAHTFEVMAGLEALSGELAAQRISNAARAEVQALHFEMMAAWTRRDLSAYYAVNARIHSAINAAAQNPVLAATYAQVNARLQALRFRSNQDEAKWRQAVREHEAMVDALQARDGPALAAVLRTHLQHKCEVVLAQLDARTPTPLNAPARARARSRTLPASARKT